MYSADAKSSSACSADADLLAGVLSASLHDQICTGSWWNDWGLLLFKVRLWSHRGYIIYKFSQNHK